MACGDSDVDVVMVGAGERVHMLMVFAEPAATGCLDDEHVTSARPRPTLTQIKNDRRGVAHSL